jgi:hypothetical protein
MPSGASPGAKPLRGDQQSMGKNLSMYVVYFDPSDYPGRYVVRQWEVGPRSTAHCSEPLIVCDTLQQAQDAVPSGLVRLARDPLDEKQIQEVWV